MSRQAFTLLCFTTVLLTGCQTLAIQGLGSGTSCITTRPAENGNFVAIAEGKNLEEAKANARLDLAQQISSTLSSRSEENSQLVNGKFQQQVTQQIKSESNSIPIDQHSIDEVCQSGDRHYAKASLSRSALINASESRLKFQLNEITSKLNKTKQTSAYERYLTKSNLEESIKKSKTLVVLLEQYSPSAKLENARDEIKRAEAFIHSNSTLHLGVIALSKETQSLLPIVEDALRISELDYSGQQKNAAVIVTLKSQQKKSQYNNRHIITLETKLTVRRSDTRELLSTPIVITKEGTAHDYEKALASAIKKTKTSLKQHHLRGDKQLIRKKLGLSES